MTRTHCRVGLVLAGLALAACSFAPRYKVLTTEAAPAAYKEMDGWKLSEPLDASARGAWWTVFNDPGLDALEAKVAGSNQDLKAAWARFQQARALARASRADLFPTITVGPSVTRARDSANAPRSNGVTRTGNDFVLEADFSYEVDVWGRLRNALRAANATAAASKADLATLDLALHAELASNYFALRSADAQQMLLDETVSDYGRALTLTQNLHKGGAAALSDVAQAEAQLHTAQTQAADNHLRRAQLEHAVAVLVGASPSNFALPPQPLPLDIAPPPIDPGLPSALLERRPDIAAAERRVASANAEIGVARAAYFPVFSLAVGGGYESTSGATWIDAPSRFWSLGAQALLTVFDAGRHAALSARARAQYDETVADYRSSVLNAYREVEDNISALRQLELESVSEKAAVVATQTAREQAKLRYHGGVATYLEVVLTQSAALQAQLSAHGIQATRFATTALLIKALGGSWHEQRMAEAEKNTPGAGKEKGP
jgi:NodT family efflux transporter outer membrane factor (OMF) lipoprotein